MFNNEFERLKTASSNALLSLKWWRTTPFDTPAISPTFSSVVPRKPYLITASNAACESSERLIELIDRACIYLVSPKLGTRLTVNYTNLGRQLNTIDL